MFDPTVDLFLVRLGLIWLLKSFFLIATTACIPGLDLECRCLFACRPWRPPSLLRR